MRFLLIAILLPFFPALSQETGHHLRDVHYLYVPDTQWRDAVIGWETVKFDGRKSLRPVGNCKTGFQTSINTGLLVVCDPKQADAALITDSSSGAAQWARQTPMRTNCESQANGNTVDTACNTTGGGTRYGSESIGSANARLILRNGEVIWNASKDNRANFGQAFALGMAGSGASHVGDESTAINRVLKQLKHDFSASEKER